MPAHSKRYYSVKEAAKILGVSTNTIYSYLDKGTLRAKRFGKGRFKIVASDLSPYLAGIERGVNGVAKKFSFLAFLGTDKGYEVKGNFVFWRIYVAYLMLTVGMVHFFWRQNLLISLPLTIAGAVTVYVAEKWEEHKILSFWMHIIDFLVLVLTVVVSFVGGYYYMVIFFGAAALTILLGFRHDINKLSKDGSLVGEYTVATLIGSFLAAIFIFFLPTFLPFPVISDFIAQNKFAVGFGILVATVPLCYVYFVMLQSKFEKRSHLEYFLFPVYGVVSVVIALTYTNLGLWDMAFAGFLYGFLTFVVLWLRHVGTITSYRKEGLLVTFGWVGIAITIGILSIYFVQAVLKNSTFRTISQKNDAVTNNINDFFTLSEATITSNIAGSNLIDIVSNGNKSSADDFAKNLYNKLSHVNRVLVYDTRGVAVGVYPISSITKGTNFSSRDYFQTSKSTGRPTLSKLFESVVGTKTVLYAVPVFSGNTFQGEVGVAYNLEDLSGVFQAVTTGGSVFAFDASSKYVLNSDPGLIGGEVPKSIVNNFDRGSFETEDSLVSCESSGVTEWTVCKSVGLGDVLQVIYISNVIIVIFLFVNAVQSLRVGFALSEKDRVHI